MWFPDWAETGIEVADIVCLIFQRLCKLALVDMAYKKGQSNCANLVGYSGQALWKGSRLENASLP
jgi:hypothetical protein